MRAVGYDDDARTLRDLDLPEPQPGPRDLRVRVAAVAINPLDVVFRRRKAGTPAAPVVLGWDAAGVVDAVGEAVTGFKPGDAVFTAGSIERPGCNAEFLLVDERLAAAKPQRLSFTAAAALPLTAITAWEALFDRLKVGRMAEPGDALLVIGGAGGVGSMAVQLARARTGLFVIATAGRPDSAEWVRALGAHAVIDHGRPLAPQLAALGHPAVRYMFPTTHTLQHWPEIVACLAPEGEVVVVDQPAGLDATLLRPKSGALHFEMMWAKAIFDEARRPAIGRLLAETAALIDAGRLRTTARADFGPLTADNVQRAHDAIASGRTIGKITLTVG